MKLLSFATIAAMAMPAAAPAATYVLDFDPGAACATTCADNSSISQAYGDVAGVVDLSYRSVASPGATVTTGDAYYWGPNYGSLSGVAWGNSGQTLEVRIAALGPSQKVTLDSVKYAAYQQVSQQTQFSVYSLGGTLLTSSGAVTSPGSGFASYAPGVSAIGGLVLHFGPDAYNSGLDDLTFSIEAAGPGVPEPASWAMMALGFGMIGFGARRRRRLAHA